MKELVVYEFEGTKFEPVQGLDGEPWFLASDVAKILRFKNVRSQVTRLPLAEAAVADSDTSGQRRKVQIVSEIGL